MSEPPTWQAATELHVRIPDTESSESVSCEVKHQVSEQEKRFVASKVRWQTA